MEYNNPSHLLGLVNKAVSLLLQPNRPQSDPLFVGGEGADSV